ncbi:MAG: phage tail protein [Pseudomonadota bacterium]
MGDESTKSAPTWPLPKFNFQVKWDDAEMAFQEVTGLDVEIEPLEYRAGNNPVFSKIKMPGMVKTRNVTLKKGVFAKDNAIWDWLTAIKMNTIERKTVTISLLDEAGAPTMVWALINAFPVKVSSTDLKAEGNEVAVESIEIGHEGIRIGSGK